MKLSLKIKPIFQTIIGNQIGIEKMTIISIARYFKYNNDFLLMVVYGILKFILQIN